MQKITTFLTFDHQAEEAVNLYTSAIRGSKITQITRYGETGPGEKGAVMTISFELAGQEFLALNGGPQFKFEQGISLMVNCETQAEIDELWEKLGAGGEYIACGWLRDRFGVSWQITPAVFKKLISGPDQARTDRVMKAMMEMVKFDIAALQRAYDGK